MLNNRIHPLSGTRQLGFTLIEVLITLVVIGIAAALASPAILAMAPNMALKSAAQDLYSSLQEAKILAIKENRDVYFYFGTDGYSIGEKFTDNNNNGIFDAGDVFNAANDDVDGDLNYTAAKQVIFADSYSYGIDRGTGAAANDWNGNPCNQAGSIAFNSRGTSQNASIFIEHKEQNICYAVTTRVAGSIKLFKFNGANWEQ